ncbi:MAG: hypothetical protein KGS72_13190 [Cyanobacteria bacterium REEB67]|nr:hypothetical protein [Cyanobacteria bacterium REEB67]
MELRQIADLPVANVVENGYISSLQLILDLPLAAKPEVVPALKIAGRSNTTAETPSTSKTLRRLFSDVLWPNEINLSAPELKQFKPKRSLKNFEGAECGEFFSDKLQRQVAYENSLERRFLRKLEYSIDVRWYVEQPFQIEYLKNGAPALYTPDVLVALEDGRFILVDVQAITSLNDVEALDKTLAMSQFCHEVGWGALITDGICSFAQLEESALEASAVSGKPVQSSSAQASADNGANNGRSRFKRRGSLNLGLYNDIENRLGGWAV